MVTRRHWLSAGALATGIFLAPGLASAIHLLNASSIKNNGEDSSEVAQADSGFTGNSTLANDGSVEIQRGTGCWSDSLTQITPLPVGDTNCPNGGSRLDTGVDDGSGQGTPGDGILEADEIETGAYICNGALSEQELSASTYVCNGPEGPAGQDGQDGENGADGEAGQPGQNGVDGQPGQNAPVVLTRTRGFAEDETDCAGVLIRRRKSA